MKPLQVRSAPLHSPAKTDGMDTARQRSFVSGAHGEDQFQKLDKAIAEYPGGP